MIKAGYIQYNVSRSLDENICMWNISCTGLKWTGSIAGALRYRISFPG